ncbi:MAG TPA: hypothetical protein VF364_11695 [Candidatus Limnocylindria bacterium]
MLNQNHPDDERLSALASHDTDATDDATLAAHVTTCERCTELVNELGVLRSALGELPDLAPSRPLQLVPPVGASAPAADRVGGWVRRFFAPVVASGAALALVGVIGTAAPAMQSFAPSAGSAPGGPEEIAATVGSAGGEPAAGGEGDTFAESSMGAQRDQEAQASDGGSLLYATDEAAAAEPSPAPAAHEDFGGDALEPERSPWPMVLFAGIAVIIGALLARWILAPRAP